MKLLNVILGMLFVWFSYASPVSAEPAPELKTAIQAWLDNDDEIAIPILSRLANAGNEDAMILLGQISLRPGLSPYLLSLDRADRNRLLKAKGGLSGKNWLRMVKKQKRLANALYNATLTEKRIDAVEVLLELNELEQASRTLNLLINNGEFEKVIYISMKQKFPDRMRFLLYYSALFSNPIKMPLLARIQRTSLLKEADKEVKSNSFQGLLFIGAVGPFLNEKQALIKRIRIGQSLLRGGMGFYSDLEYWSFLVGKENPKKAIQKEWEYAYSVAFEKVLSASETRPLIGFCKKRCPSNINACVKYIYGAGTGFAGLMRRQTPVSKLISSSDYYNSERFGDDLLSVPVKYHFDFWRKRQPKKFNSCISNLFAK